MVKVNFSLIRSAGKYYWKNNGTLQIQIIVLSRWKKIETELKANRSRQRATSDMHSGSVAIVLVVVGKQLPDVN